MIEGWAALSTSNSQWVKEIDFFFFFKEEIKEACFVYSFLYFFQFILAERKKKVQNKELIIGHAI